MASKFYAVRKGKTPGIYRTWDECKAMVNGFSGAEYKSFATKEEAYAFMGITVGDKGGNTWLQKETDGCIQLQKESDVNAKSQENIEKNRPYAFVDGSFNIATKVYGYGGFLYHDGKKEILKGSGNDAGMASMRNVAGEVLGSMAAVKKALELGLDSLDIYYDYMGIEMWAKGLWKRNKKGTIDYYNYISSVRDKIDLKFVKVKGHSGVEGNEEADRLAKEAVKLL